jgi:hypothetical protein
MNAFTTQMRLDAEEIRKVMGATNPISRTYIKAADLIDRLEREAAARSFLRKKTPKKKAAPMPPLAST